MESLLANYGSDDEEDEPQQQPTRAPLSASLPPPKAHDDQSSDVLARRSFLFASLPRPKLASEDAGKSYVRDTEYRDERKALGATSISGRRDPNDRVGHKETDDDSMVGVTADGVADKAKQGPNAQSAATAPFSDGASVIPSTRVSLFRALPPPKNAGSSLVSVTSQGSSGPTSKRVVEIRPSINMALLQEPDDDDDDDDVKPPVKRLATEGTAGGKLTGLAAVLPKPRNLGSALGSGSALGHQATLDLGTPATSLPSASESALGCGYTSGHTHATLDVGNSGSFLPSSTEALSSSASLRHSTDESLPLPQQYASELWSNDADYGGSYGTTNSLWEGHDVGTSLQDHPEAASAPYLCMAVQEGANAHYSENYYPAAHEASTQDALAEMLMREKRKGGRNDPVNVIEVKQADLTATKVREDHLRTTGIAFGPAYKPMSTSKNKPSKLHRRKHQIGSLYYDMKQKETELMERRAKGHMTKAETQAKYGW